MNDNVTSMFCWQCEQTFGGAGCTRHGVCGKSAEIAAAQDRLTCELVKFARTLKTRGGGVTPPQARLIADGLFTCVTNVDFDRVQINALADKVSAENGWLCGCGSCPSFDLKSVWESDPDIRSLKSLLLFGLRGLGAFAHHAAALGSHDARVDGFFVKGLAALAENLSSGELMGLVHELGLVNLRCMDILEKAHVRAFGTPAPAKVSTDVEPGPFIVVTGHDLKDLKELLRQSERSGVNVYTHGEMLPAHGYPELRKYPHLKGNYGTAWQNQQREFAELPAPILWTTNCLMIPQTTYAANVWTTGVVRYPGAHVIPEKDGRKDFTDLIAAAKRLGGWSEKRSFAGVNGGHWLWTGHGHVAVTSLADKIVAAVQAGHIGRFLLVGGCDGAKPGRNYYTELVKNAPKDTVVLTLACGKYRFNDLDLGAIDGIPRLLDVGQCNDAYGAIRIALALAKAFGCGVNQLPIAFVLSWYEQKAVAVLLTLLALGIRDIRLGPSLPAFLSPNVRAALTAKYGLRSITTAARDLGELYGKM